MKEILYDDLIKGMQLPDMTYALTDDVIDKYLEAIDDLNPLYLDEEYAKKTPFNGRIVPPISMAIYSTVSSVIKPLKQKTPPGLIHASQKFEFTGLVRPGDELLIKTIVEDKYEKKGRKYVVFKSEVFNKDGQKIGTSWLSPIWPK
ncbi:MAG: MaoC family dehydratase [Proteobacteria bacterium]|nr:MaoC family dehydratase [Pseudomonadota bacterium]MBU4009948.1 MaoC family dehydratase [Pseudomonadota bacterium]